MRIPKTKNPQKKQAPYFGILAPGTATLGSAPNNALGGPGVDVLVRDIVPDLSGMLSWFLLFRRERLFWGVA